MRYRVSTITQRGCFVVFSLLFVDLPCIDAGYEVTVAVDVDVDCGCKM